MSKKLQVIILVLALGVSLITLGIMISDSPPVANADSEIGPDCIVGPGNCGCYLGAGSCYFVGQASPCPGEPGQYYWELREYSADVFANGKRALSYLYSSDSFCSYWRPTSTCNSCG